MEQNINNFKNIVFKSGYLCLKIIILGRQVKDLRYLSLYTAKNFRRKVK
jgi:hypothetical protein